MLRCAELASGVLADLLAPYSLTVAAVADGQTIPGSYWGEPEAGLISSRLFVRADTPVHSALHEACHYICMTPARRARLHKEAGGTVLEECAVCYLQIILADCLAGFGREQALADMDAWGYSFRLGSARRWFSEDATDARDWLLQQDLVNQAEQPTWYLRGMLA